MSQVSRLKLHQQVILRDITNNIVCTGTIELPAEPGKLKSWFKKSEDIKQADLNRVEIKIEKDGKIVGTGQ